VSDLRARKGPRTILGLLAAVGLVAALAMPVFAGAEVDWADVTGYAEGTAENNSPDTWGDNCEDAGVNGQDTWVLPDLAEGEVYDLVIVKTASEQSAPGHVNTLFDDPSEGQTVWADSDGSGAFSEDDKGISHIIVCTAEEQVEESEAPESEAPESEAPSSEAPESEAPASEPAASERGGELGGTPTPAPSTGEVPDTAMGDFGQTPATVLSLVLIAALAGMVYVRLARQR
jgi:hypothetical protein